jgi:hypothetical protein
VSSEAAQLPVSGMASTPSLAFRYNVPEANKVTLKRPLSETKSD